MKNIINNKKNRIGSIKNLVNTNTINDRRQKREDKKNEIEQLRESIQSNNVIKETSTSFEIDKKDNSIIINSSEEVKVNIQSFSSIIIMHIERSDNATLKSTEITVSGFANIIYKYEDNRLTSSELTASDDGKVHFIQDISKDHIVFLQLKKSTIYLDETTGWSQPVGTWDAKTRIAKLTVPVINDEIVINTDYVILDGLQSNNVKSVISGVPLGISVDVRQNITIKNIDIENCDLGIYINESDYINISKNIINNCVDIGIFIEDSNRNIDINNNLITNTAWGIGVYEENLYTTIENNIINNVENAIRFYGYNKLAKIINNTISIIDYKKVSDYVYGIYFEYENNNDILIEKNTIEIINNTLTNTVTSIYPEIYGIGFDEDYNNFITVLNNKITLAKNSINTIGQNLQCYLYGIYLYNDESGTAVVSNNKVTVENNTVSVDNNYEIYDEIYGIYLADEDIGNYKCEGNKIFVNANVIVPYGGNITVNYIAGIYLGYYNGAISVNNNEIEMLNNITNGVIDEDNIISAIYFYEYNVGWLIESNNINIQNNNMGAQGYCLGVYFYYKNNGNTISSNIIKMLNNKGTTISVYGIYFEDNNYGNKILNNTISNNQGTAIYLDYNNDGNSIEKNKLSNNDENGIYFGEINKENIIQSNTITNNKLYGIYMSDDNDNNNIIDNNISNNVLDGIYLDYYNDLIRIRYNIISRNTNGIYLNDSTDQDNDTNKIECNIIKYNSGYGIFIGAYNPDNVIKNNTISKNKNGLFIQLNSVSNIIKYNNFIKGSGYNAYDANALGINSFYSNYWSDWNGVAPYYVNGLPGGPEDPKPSKVRLYKCKRECPITEHKPIKVPYKCNHARQHYKCEAYEENSCHNGCKE